MGCCVMCCLLLTILLAVNANGDYTFGTFFVANEDDGTPSLDTGLYLLSQAVPYNGTLRELDTCGYVVATNVAEGNVVALTQFFFVTAYRQVGDNYRRLYDPLPFAFSIGGNETFGCRRQTIGRVDFHLMSGDRIGVFIQNSPCVNIQGTFACPAHVNLVDPQKNCSQVIYFPNTATLAGNTLPPSHSVTDGNPENFFINMDAIIEPASPLPPSSTIPSRSCANLEPTSGPSPNLAIPIGGLGGRGLVMVIAAIFSLAITKIF